MALKRLTLRDFVIVSALELDFADGFSVLTGETGAGKSILIDALQLVLGARAEASVVRDGAERADISAEFDVPKHLQVWLSDAGLEVPQNEPLLLRRTIDSQGKSRAWINGVPATATQLRELADGLLDIHGQHAWQSLTRPDSVAALLDAYGLINTKTLKAAWQEWRRALEVRQKALAAQANLQQERERLQWQLSELDKLKPQPHEWEDLNAQHTRLSHLNTLLEAAQSSLHWLEGQEQSSEGQAASALDSLSQAQRHLSEQSHLEPAFSALIEVLNQSLVLAQDAAHSLHAWLRHTDLDPERLAELDARMGLWMGLARRFRSPPEELPQLQMQWQAELTELDSATDLEALDLAVTQAEKSYRQAAQSTSQARHQTAPKLSEAISEAMQTLGMAGGRFEVALTPLAEPSANGLESIEFLVAGHPGATPKPVAKVASGGELSRLALAIAVTTSQLGQAPTLIFDEVDAGVGGAVAHTVGRLMQRLGHDRQVLAVTHLAQVAACADQHLQVSKSGALSTVKALAPSDRVMEIARMLGGDVQSTASMAHAREMLSQEKWS